MILFLGFNLFYFYLASLGATRVLSLLRHRILMMDEFKDFYTQSHVVLPIKGRYVYFERVSSSINTSFAR